MNQQSPETELRMTALEAAMRVEMQQPDSRTVLRILKTAGKFHAFLRGES